MITSPEKLKMGGSWKYGAGTGLLKRGWRDWHFSYLVFSFHLEITLPFAKLRYAFEEKLFFSATIIFGKKVIVSFLKMNLKTSRKLRKPIRKGI